MLLPWCGLKAPLPALSGGEGATEKLMWLQKQCRGRVCLPNIKKPDYNDEKNVLKTMLYIFHLEKKSHTPEPARSVPASHPQEWSPPVWLLRESLPSKSWMAISLTCIRSEPWKSAWQSTSLAHILDVSNYWTWTAFFMAMRQLPLVTMPGMHIAISPLQNIRLSFFLPILSFLLIKLYGS